MVVSYSHVGPLIEARKPLRQILSGGHRKESLIESIGELAPSKTVWCPCPSLTFPPFVSRGLKLEGSQPNSVGVGRDSHGVQYLGDLPQPVLGIYGRAFPCVAR